MGPEGVFETSVFWPLDALPVAVFRAPLVSGFGALTDTSVALVDVVGRSSGTISETGAGDIEGAGFEGTGSGTAAAAT